ncbi:MAG: SRPBCC family protein [Phycisphaeraceae bacterium]|nr:SRPBCC family protein [Phycisphaeraceae bacterium]
MLLRDHAIFILEISQELPLPLDSVFPFFAAPENLEAITPPWLNFRILTPRPIQMKQGARIDYSIRLRGIPLRWRTEITLFEPPHRFVDLQVRGPYSFWEHTHTFAATSTGTRIMDRVCYLPPKIPLFATLLEQQRIPQCLLQTPAH